MGRERTRKEKGRRVYERKEYGEGTGDGRKERELIPVGFGYIAA